MIAEHKCIDFKGEERLAEIRLDNNRFKRPKHLFLK